MGRIALLTVSALALISVFSAHAQTGGGPGGPGGGPGGGSGAGPGAGDGVGRLDND